MLELSHFWLFVPLWTLASQAPLSTGFSRQEYWSGCHPLLQGNLSGPGIKPMSSVSPWIAGRFFTHWAIGEAQICQFSSVAQSCLTLCDPMDCSKPGFPVHYQLLEFTQTHVHWVSDAIQPSHPLSSPSPPAFNFSQHQGLFRWVSSSHQVAKVLEFQLHHQSFQWIFRADFLGVGPVLLFISRYTITSAI